MSNTQWHGVVGYPSYEVSDNGQVRSVKSGSWQLLKPAVSHYGYHVINLCDELGEKKQFKVHRLVCKAFNGSPPDDMPFVNHKDGNKLNNRPSNLEWTTRPENNRHATATGLNNKASEFHVIIHNETTGTAESAVLHAHILDRFAIKPHILEMLLRHYPHRRLRRDGQEYTFEAVIQNGRTNDRSQVIKVTDVKTGESFTAESQRIAAIKTGASRYSVYASLQSGKPASGFLFENL